MKLVRGPNACEDPVGQSDGGLFGGHEAADMGQKRDQCDLFDVGALAGHVRARDEQE